MRATAKLVLRKYYVTKGGKQQLCLRYIAHKKSVYIGLGISILPKHWDEKSLMVRVGEAYCQQYNQVITKIHNKAKELIMANYFSPLPIELFRERLKDKQTESADFYGFVEKEIEVLKIDRSEGTISNYCKLLNTMKLWKPTLNFDEITLDFIEKFHTHEMKQGNLESTINKKHANFKFLIGRAILKEKIDRNPYERFAIKKCIKAQNEDVLTEAEVYKLQQIYDSKVYSKGKQEVLRDFLFSCYTSLAFAEFEAVTYADIKEYTIKGECHLILSSERTKTGCSYKLPIVSPKVTSLLGSGKHFQKIFSPLSNQPTNRYLSEIMKDANIHKKITFHRGRHIFRTIAARKGIREQVAELIMGHSSKNHIQAIYTHLTDEDLIQEMAAKWIA